MRTHISSVGLVIAPDQAASFEYPSHIDRASIDALPSHPGIYIFRGVEGVPLYIGKSVNIRSRVLSHLRTPEEARMLQQSTHVEFSRTAGEIGALLLESQLIKTLQPLHNRKLRRVREMCALRIQDHPVPDVVFGHDIDFATAPGLYGLFSTRKSALERLRMIVDTHCLCPAVTGLEKQVRGRPCFARQIARCLGACTGEESAAAHHARLLAALEELRIMPWPFDAAMGIIEEHEGWRQVHVVDRWHYRGSIDGRKKITTRKLAQKKPFDIDTYNILAKPLMRGELRIMPLPV